MRYDIALCDDDERTLEHMKSLVKAWASARGHEAGLTACRSAEAALFAMDGHMSDICLLDIEMPGENGVGLAKAIRRRSDRTQIVFVTGYPDYIAEGYEVSALHYLLKPVSQVKLFEVLDRACERLRKEERALTLELADQLVRVPLSRIRYIDVRLNYVTVHADEDHTVKKPLSDVERMLDDRFYRVGRSCIVNLTKITRVTRTEVFLSGGVSVPLPRGAYEPLNRAIIERI